LSWRRVDDACGHALGGECFDDGVPAALQGLDAFLELLVLAFALLLSL